MGVSKGHTKDRPLSSGIPAPRRRRLRLRVLSVVWVLLGIAGLIFGAALVLDAQGIAVPGPELALESALSVVFFIFIIETLRNLRHLPKPNLVGVTAMLILLCFLLSLIVQRILHPTLSVLSLALSFTFLGLILLVWVFQAKRSPYEHLLVLPCLMQEDLIENSTSVFSFKAAGSASSAGSLDAQSSQDAETQGQDSFDGIVFDPKDPISPEWHDFILQQRFANKQVYEASNIYEQVTGRVSLRHLDRGYTGDLAPQRRWYHFAKRPLDVLCVILTLPITLLIMLVTAVLIRIESPGKIFFTQKRIGYGNKPFTIYKFRSMRMDSEADGSQFAKQQDARITKIGAFIRKFRIDELPQVWNILKGEMSWIGPRPEQPIFVREFESTIPYYASRHLVLPGITGWAQVMQGYAASSEETAVKLSYDLYYLKNFSHWLDLLIVYKTLKTILTGFGAR